LEEVSAKLTVYFDGQFWIGVFEKTTSKKLAACRYVFGAEPKDTDVYELILNKWKFLKFSPAVNVENNKEFKICPKKMQKKINALLSNNGIGTKAQQAIKLQIEHRKSERKEYNKEKNEEEKQFQFELRQQKKKEKHKGH
jgi:hypothetical protein